MLIFSLKGSSINCYLDNNALESLIKGDSNTTIIAAIVATSWRLLQKFIFDIFVGRVSPKLNIADRPTRTKAEMPYECGILTEFRELFRILTVVRTDRRNISLSGDSVKSYSSK